MQSFPEQIREKQSKKGSKIQNAVSGASSRNPELVGDTALWSRAFPLTFNDPFCGGHLGLGGSRGRGCGRRDRRGVVGRGRRRGHGGGGGGVSRGWGGGGGTTIEGGARL